MAKTREVQRIHYVCEGNCDLGKKRTFWKNCQTCKTCKTYKVHTCKRAFWLK